MGRRHREPLDQEILQYTSSGQFVRSYASITAAADYLKIAESAIYNSIALRKICYDFAFVYRSEIPRIPEEINVGAFRPHRPRKETAPTVAARLSSLTASNIERYYDRRRKRISELLSQAGLQFNIVYGKTKGKACQRVSAYTLFVDRALLQKKAEDVVDLIRREIESGQIIPYKFDVVGKNFKEERLRWALV